MTKAFEEDMESLPARNIPSPGQLDPDTRIPVINLEDGTRLVGEDAPKNKDLVEWLKLHPTYTVDMPSYVPVSMRFLKCASAKKGLQILKQIFSYRMQSLDFVAGWISVEVFSLSYTYYNI